METQILFSCGPLQSGATFAARSLRIFVLVHAVFATSLAQQFAANLVAGHSTRAHRLCLVLVAGRCTRALGSASVLQKSLRAVALVRNNLIPRTPECKFTMSVGLLRFLKLPTV